MEGFRRRMEERVFGQDEINGHDDDDYRRGRKRAWVEVGAHDVTSADLAGAASAGLLLEHLDDVLLLHVQRQRRVAVVNAAAVEEEAQRGERHADAIAVGLLQLAEGGGLLHAKVKLVGVLADHLDLDVLLVLVLVVLCHRVCFGWLVGGGRGESRTEEVGWG